MPVSRIYLWLRMEASYMMAGSISYFHFCDSTTNCHLVDINWNAKWLFIWKRHRKSTDEPITLIFIPTMSPSLLWTFVALALSALSQIILEHFLWKIIESLLSTLELIVHRHFSENWAKPSVYRCKELEINYDVFASNEWMNGVARTIWLKSIPKSKLQSRSQMIAHANPPHIQFEVMSQRLRVYSHISTHLLHCHSH